MFPSWCVTVENGALPTKAAVRACYLTLLTPKLPRFCLQQIILQNTLTSY